MSASKIAPFTNLWEDTHHEFPRDLSQGDALPFDMQDKRHTVSRLTLLENSNMLPTTYLYFIMTEEIQMTFEDTWDFSGIKFSFLGIQNLNNFFTW